MVRGYELPLQDRVALVFLLKACARASRSEPDLNQREEG